MGQSDDIEDSTYSRHQDLCQKLNMDATAASEAWESYEDIRQKYSLEGDQLHWIGCALYVACRKSSTPTVGRTGSNVEGNCVSLTRLLRLCNLSLTQFFNKSKSWADMTHMPQDLRSKIDKLERNFVVSMVIFKKYQPIFTDIFKNPADDIARPMRSRRHRAMPCTPSKVFEFCWTLFVCIKGAFPDISADLVNLNHLLIVCCDLIYSNALLANRRDLLNPNFAGLPANYNDENYTPPETANCIISLLCEHREGIAVEAKVIKEYYLKNHLNKMFNEKILRGEQSDFSGILEPLNFDGNSKAVNKAYEQHVLSVGDFDERKFLVEWRRVRLNGISRVEILRRDITFHPKLPWHSHLKDADASDNIGSPTKIAGVGDFHEQYLLKREQYSGQMQHLAPPTPLTGRKYLRSKDMAIVTPVSIANQSVSRLQALLAGHKPKPSDALKEMLNSCTQEIEASIEAKVYEIGEQFCKHYSQNTEGDARSVDFGRKRLLLAQTLFYKLLETILNDEKGKKPSFDITTLLSQEIFHQCLFACCLEIVIYAHNSHRKFPWILNALNLEAYYFYKVIEIIVRSEDQLSREIVKHLNLIEEQILETLAWNSESPLWEAIEKTPDGVPSYEEVSLPGTLHLESVDPNTPGQPVLRRIALDRGNHHDVQQSPISSASERFQSPVAATGLAKKRLFSDGRHGVQQSVLRVGSGQSVLQSKLLTIEGDQKLLLPPNQITVLKNTGPSNAGSPMQTISVNKEPAKPRRTGSVALFFRKFYYLAWIRMNDLCTKLELSGDIELKKKIWTIFEYSVKDQTHLMKDRHLDQILMCAVYVMCKIAKLDKNSFTEIMRCYRLQPQAESHIYRSVLIVKTNPTETNSREPTEQPSDNNTEQENNTAAAPPTPTCMAGTSQNYGSEVRGDLIKFYNTVYVPHVKEYANKFTSRGSMNLTLSPLPKSKPTAKSPVRRVTDSVLTRTLDPKAITATPAPHQLSYCFSRSPAKDLEAINKLVISLDARKTVGKRLLTDDTDVDMTSVEHSPAKKTTTPFVARKLEHIIGDRRTQSQ